MEVPTDSLSIGRGSVNSEQVTGSDPEKKRKEKKRKEKKRKEKYTLKFYNRVIFNPPKI